MVIEIFGVVTRSEHEVMRRDEMRNEMIELEDLKSKEGPESGWVFPSQIRENQMYLPRQFPSHTNRLYLSSKFKFPSRRYWIFPCTYLAREPQSESGQVRCYSTDLEVMRNPGGVMMMLKRLNCTSEMQRKSYGNRWVRWR